MEWRKAKGPGVVTEGFVGVGMLLPFLAEMPTWLALAPALGEQEISPQRQPLSSPEPSGPGSSEAPWKGGRRFYQLDKPTQDPVAPGPDWIGREKVSSTGESGSDHSVDDETSSH